MCMRTYTSMCIFRNRTNTAHCPYGLSMGLLGRQPGTLRHPRTILYVLVRGWEGVADIWLGFETLR